MVQVVEWHVKGCFGCILCQKRLRWGKKGDECKPLPGCPSRWRRSGPACTAHPLMLAASYAATDHIGIQQSSFVSK